MLPSLCPLIEPTMLGFGIHLLFRLEALRVVIAFKRFTQPVAVGIGRVGIIDKRNDIPYMVVKRDFVALLHQRHTVFVALLLTTPMSGVESIRWLL